MASIFFADPPKIISVTPSSTQTVFVGSKTNFTCEAEGNPTPQYMWIQKWDGNPPTYLDRGHVSTLIIRNTTYDYQGKYVCRVVNRISGRDNRQQSQEIILDVKGKS